MYYGVQYYPEHWPAERWPVDAAMMQRAGVNTVRMGEFAWSAIEPCDGVQDFSLMDTALGILADHGIRAIMCTPSRTPPPWVFRKYPGIANTQIDGKLNNYGFRYTVGLAHHEFVAASQRIDRAVVEHYAGNPAIAGWQIDNEIGQNNDCYCEHCLALFHDYLQHKYGTVEALNEAWGPHFWSFNFADFSEVPAPREDHANPQLALEYRRFLSQLNVDFARWRYEMIHAVDPGKFVTTNFQSAVAQHTDYHAMARTLDINGTNYYPARSPEFLLDFYRGKGRKLLVLEQCTRLEPVDSGEGWMRLWAWQAIAHGVSGINFFRWRTCRWGQEQHADGILPHGGQENRRYRELVRMGREIADVGDLIDRTYPVARVALVNSYEARWALNYGVKLKEARADLEVARYHDALVRQNVTTDAMDPHEDLTGYQLVLAPRLFAVDAAVAANLERFVRKGGVLCLTAASGVVDEYNKSFDVPRPGPLRGPAGIEVSDLSPLHAPVPLRAPAIPGLDGAQAGGLADEIHPQTAEVLAEFDGGWRRGLPAITLNRYGRGSVVYVGTILEGEALAALVRYLRELAGVEAVMGTPAGVMAHERRGDGWSLLFLLNYTDAPVTVTVPGAWRDAFTQVTASEVEVQPVDMRLLVAKA